MKNAVFWDIKIQFVPHRRHITSTLQSSVSEFYVSFELFTAVTMKNAIFLDVTPCDCCKNRRFRGMYRLHYKGERNQLLVAANVVPTSLMTFTCTRVTSRKKDTWGWMVDRLQPSHPTIYLGHRRWPTS
jgi:hypothetical protein